MIKIKINRESPFYTPLLCMELAGFVGIVCTSIFI